MTRDQALDKLGGIAAWLDTIRMTMTANEIRQIILALEDLEIVEGDTSESFLYDLP